MQQLSWGVRGAGVRGRWPVLCFLLSHEIPVPSHHISGCACAAHHIPTHRTIQCAWAPPRMGSATPAPLAPQAHSLCAEFSAGQRSLSSWRTGAQQGGRSENRGTVSGGPVAQTPCLAGSSGAPALPPSKSSLLARNNETLREVLPDHRKKEHLFSFS